MEANNKAMREALVEIDELTNLLDISENKKNLLFAPSHSFVAVKMRKIIKKALEEPARNCDRFDSCAEARVEWWKFEARPRVEGVVSGTEQPFEEWLFAPTTEQKGETDGSK